METSATPATGLARGPLADSGGVPRNPARLLANAGAFPLGDNLAPLLVNLLETRCLVSAATRMTALSSLFHNAVKRNGASQAVECAEMCGGQKLQWTFSELNEVLSVGVLDRVYV